MEGIRIVMHTLVSRSARGREKPKPMGNSRPNASQAKAKEQSQIPQQRGGQMPKRNAQQALQAKARAERKTKPKPR